MQPKSFGPLNHFDYALLDKYCTCDLCQEHRAALESYHAILASTAEHTSDCKCDLCRRVYKARSVSIAVTNRRDLYCESSFHAKIEPTLGILYMTWIAEQVKLGFENRTTGWWEHSAHDRSMRYWFNQFHAVSGLAVSGVAA